MFSALSITEAFLHENELIACVQRANENDGNLIPEV